MRAAAWALIAAAALGAVFGLHTIADPDLHQQIAVGRAILADPASIGTSTFTHTHPGFRYVEDKWLASVFVALVDRWGGVDALMLYQIALAAIAAVAWFLMLRVWSAAPWGALFGTSVLLVAGAFRLEPRPDTLSHALLAAVLALLGSGVAIRRAAPALVALMVLWVNVHGYFVNGVLVIAAAVAAAGCGDPRGPLATPERRRALLRGALVLAAAAAACVIHPQGLAAATWPIRQVMLLRAEPALRTALTEFAPSLDLLAGGGLWRVVLLLVAPAAGLAFAVVRAGSDARVRVATGSALAAIWLAVPAPGAAPWPYRLTLALWIAAAVEAPRAARERRLFPVFVFAGFTVLAIPMIRNLSLVPPAAAIVLVPAWAQALRTWTRVRGLARLALAGAVLCVAGAAWARLADHLAPGTYRAPAWTGWGLARDRFPEAAAGKLAAGEVPGEILNNYDTSGYLLYRMHPERRAFIVDNTSMYPAAFLEEYRSKVMAGRIDADVLHERWGVRTVVLDHAAMETAGLVGRLARSPAWRLVALDRAAAVWVRADGGGIGGDDANRGGIGGAAGVGTKLQTIDLDEAVRRLAVEPIDRSLLPAWLAPRSRVFPALNFGIFLRAAGRPDLALLEADRLWNEAPSVELATFSAAAMEESDRLALAVPRLAAARSRFGGAPALDDWLARALFVRGVARLERREVEGSRADFVAALELAPRSGGAALALARLEVSLGNSGEARRWLSRALSSSERAGIAEAVRSDPQLAALAGVDSQPPR